jgi:formylglycine-generating enzyme required for sulfatase activity
LRGGSFLNNYDALRCGFDYINTIEGSNADNVGFRCCSSP